MILVLDFSLNKNYHCEWPEIEINRTPAFYVYQYGSISNSCDTECHMPHCYGKIPFLHGME